MCIRDSLLIAAHARLARREFPAQEPLEVQCEEELGSDDGQDEDERDVEHDLAGNAADGFRVDGAHFDDVLETLRDLLARATLESEGHIDAMHSWVGADVIELAWVRDLRLVEPLKQIEIQHIARVDHEVAAGVLDIVPGEEDVARAAQAVEVLTGILRCVATVSE